MRFLQILLLCLLPISLQAQQNTVSAGGDAVGKTGSFSYTVGQIDYVSANAGMAVATAVHPHVWGGLFLSAFANCIVVKGSASPERTTDVV